jgi:hypothetical protein
MPGAAVATVLTEAFRMGLAFHLARGLALPLPPVARLWKPFAAAGLMAGVMSIAPTTGLLGPVAVGAAAYAGALMLLGGVRRDERGWPALDV